MEAPWGITVITLPDVFGLVLRFEATAVDLDAAKAQVVPIIKARTAINRADIVRILYFFIIKPFLLIVFLALPYKES